MFCHVCNCSFSHRNDIVDVDLRTVKIRHGRVNDGAFLCLVVDHGIVQEDAHHRTPATTNISTNRFRLKSSSEFLLVRGWTGIKSQGKTREKVTVLHRKVTCKNSHPKTKSQEIMSQHNCIKTACSIAASLSNFHW